MAFDLSSIRKTDGNNPAILAIYGQEGVGKTTIGSQAPSPIFIQTEQGEGKLEIDAFPIVNAWAELVEALNTLITQEHNFKTLVIDSVDHLEQRVIWQEVCRVGDEKGSRESIEEFGYGKGYKYALQYWHKFFDALQILRNKKGMNIILIAHNKIKKFESPITEPYDRYQVKLHDTASEFLRESVDALLFAHEKTVVQKSDSGFGKSTTRGVSTGRRIFGTTETAAYQAKNRFAMPQEIELSWDAIKQYL